MSTSSSISSSFRLFKPILPSSTPLPKPTTLSFFPKRPITFQPIATSSPSSTSSQPIEEISDDGDLPPPLLEIVTLFQSVPLPRARYEQLLFYGKTLPPLNPIHKTQPNKVEGCVSQVWVHAYLDPTTTRHVVHFEADSDALISKGLAALLVKGLSGQPVEEVLKVKPDFATRLGLRQSLSPGRNNGFLNMLRLMQKKARELVSGSGSDEGFDEESGKGLSFVGNGENPSGNVADSGLELGKGLSFGEKAEISSENVADSDKGLSSGENAENLREKFTDNGGVLGEIEVESGGLGSRETRIREALERELRPVELEVEDISYQHAGHAAVRGSGDGETHFNVRVVAEAFEGKSLIKRHRMVYALLQEELEGGLHALSIEAKTPKEVSKK